MNEVKVLLEGRAKKTHEGWDANSAVVLVKSDGKKIIVDPGCEKKRLIDALKKEKLSAKQIDYVVLTHSHEDHAMLAGIFRNAKIITKGNSVPGTGVRLLKTPGHTSDHISVVVNAREGKYVIAGDVFWWMDGEEQVIDINKEDPACVSNMGELVESRKALLGIADYIIPGHGKIFKVEK
ncbi:MBL fold metallo-hydrolase [Candidatus Micrarchaeota archaeon]|nr:MBL fold metallo-hydrolase [Candidatus Micrarchaeota archaeon]